MKVFLETERLILRYLTEADGDNLFQLDQDPQVMYFINGGQPTDYEIIKNKVLPRFLAYYEKYENLGTWGVVEKKTQNFLGWILFRPACEFIFASELNLAEDAEIELGYRLCQSSWGKGYATEGSKALINKGFRELNVKKVCAFALERNKASRRVMEKSGLKIDREFMFTEQQLPYFKEEVDRKGVKYALTQEDFLKINKT
ncbi:acetyltransferase, putative [Gloeothece citriformis PCC 7424]|uniref:Acetyltransferase, putative n=1 Tax=Gloeothece citriformis (strain PCC 7424) TaxID=65393 RepID=B7KIB8_GLOC7|nr:GNAT family N-acetyltransferase [Gloeothece citriformis]ACK73605.1 acetyltransferase, putative [Gloeothece citriformis PCC 7424]